jgi:hypothetical protein
MDNITLSPHTHERHNGTRRGTNKQMKTSLVSTEWEPDPKVARRFNVCQKTIDRWSKNPTLDFPKPMEINGRKYRKVRELEEWSAARVRASIRKA